MVQKLGKKTSRRALTWSHWLFQQRLKWMCEKNGSKLHIVTEEYTSKTCTGCGTIKNIGGNKIYKCSKCGLDIDRDINGARNILLKTLTE